MDTKNYKKTTLLIGIAGSNNAFSLSLYNLKAYALNDPQIKELWNFPVIQHPLINVSTVGSLARKKLKALIDNILQVKPDLLVISCYMWNVLVFKEIAKEIKAQLPSTPILWGGPEMARDYLLEGKYDAYDADFCISGEGELPFLELLKNLTCGTPDLSKIPGLSFRKDRQGPFCVNEKRNPFKSLAEIPSPFLSGCVDDEVLARSGVEANLETQRGCTLRCSYCMYHKDMSIISYSSIQRIIDEVRYVCERGVRRLRFVDANFASDLDHAKAVMRALIKENIEAKIMLELIPGFIDEELASLFDGFNNLYEWNRITIGIGVQTINLDILRKLKRGIRLEKFEKTFDLLENYDIHSKIDLIIGLPGEDIGSIEKTLEYFLDRLRNSSAHLLCCHVMRGLPGTELLNMAKEHQMVFSSKKEPHEFIESPILPRKDMLRCLRRTAVIFRLVNHEGWAGTEFVRGETSQDTSIRNCFFSTRDRLGVSNVGLIDILIDRLMPYLQEKHSCFSEDDFPYAETWWWVWSKREIPHDWLVECLNNLTLTEGKQTVIKKLK